MKSNLYRILGLGAALLLIGCNGQSNLPKRLKSKGNIAEESTELCKQATSTTSKIENNYNVANNCNIKLSPIEYAQKEYLDAYNDYVRLLRESGPQTIETLQALAIYQKKYQIYEMLVKASKNNETP